MKPDIFVTSMVTESCDLHCKYCYMNEKTKREMSLDTTKKLIKSFLDYNNKAANFNWIGGEPLSRGISFFEEISEFTEENNSKNLAVHHSIQSNGLSMTPETFHTLYNLGWNVGISYDGTPGIQLLQRGLIGKKQEQLLDNLKNTGKKVGIISVLTKNSVGKEEEIYDFLRDHTTRAKLNFYSPIGRGSDRETELLPTKDEAKEIMVNFYELWKKDDSDFVLSPYNEIVRSFFTGLSTICGYSAVSCYQSLGVNVEGDIYLCSRGMHLPEMRLGNIEEGLDNLLGTEKHTAVLRRYLDLRNKTKDPWFSYSAGGCPLEALVHDGGFMNEAYYGNEVRNPLFNKIKEDLENEKIGNLLERKAGFK